LGADAYGLLAPDRPLTPARALQPYRPLTEECLLAALVTERPFRPDRHLDSSSSSPASKELLPRERNPPAKSEPAAAPAGGSPAVSRR